MVIGIVIAAVPAIIKIAVTTSVAKLCPIMFYEKIRLANVAVGAAEAGRAK